MPIPLRPQLRPLNILPFGQGQELLFVFHDPEGFGGTIVAPYQDLILVALMDGTRTLAEIQAAFRDKMGIEVARTELERIVAQLDGAYLLAGERFEEYRREQAERYLSNPLRPAAHAGGAYADDPNELREELAGYFTAEGGPGAVDPNAVPDGRQLCGIVSPHIDPHRGGPGFAWAYKKLVEKSDADLFVIFGTAHGPMRQMFSVSRKDFDTPLGVLRTDTRFVDRLARHLASSVAGRQVDLFEDELAHRHEHSIEFQVVFLQYLLGRKHPFRVVPVLTGPFQDFLESNTPPDESPEVQAFIAGMRAAAAEHPGRVCFISGADLAHIGRRFGDEKLLDEQRLAEQTADDRKLLEAVCRCDCAGFFRHVAEQDDRGRICGLSPMYTMLQVANPACGELLKYDQAVEPDGTSCVSFASLAFYRE